MGSVPLQAIERELRQRNIIPSAIYPVKNASFSASEIYASVFMV